MNAIKQTAPAVRHSPLRSSRIDPDYVEPDCPQFQTGFADEHHDFPWDPRVGSGTAGLEALS